MKGQAMIDLHKQDYWTRYVPFMHGDSPAPFIQEAFQHYRIKTSVGDVAIKSMLSSYELSLLFALAKDYWTGAGEIVDLGCLYGLTTRCLSEGVLLNTNVPKDRKRRRIYAYDLFLAEDYDWWTQSSDTVHAGSWFSEFLDVNRDQLDFIAPCPGNLTRMAWGDRPIEILMVDAAKSWELNHWIVSHMFPRLIPGRSVVIQQDYVNFAEYWIAITMEHLRQYFEPLDFIYGATAVYLLTKPIPSEAMHHDLAVESAQTKFALLERAIRLSPPSVTEVLKVAKAKMFVDLGDQASARDVLATVRTDVKAERKTNDFSEIAAGCLRMLALEMQNE
jgi:hypothetical protein